MNWNDDHDSLKLDVLPVVVRDDHGLLYPVSSNSIVKILQGDSSLGFEDETTPFSFYVYGS